MYRAWTCVLLLAALAIGTFCPFAKSAQAHTMGLGMGMGPVVMVTHVEAPTPECCLNAQRHQEATGDVVREVQAPQSIATVVTIGPFSTPAIACIDRAVTVFDRYGPLKFERRCVSKRE